MLITPRELLTPIVGIESLYDVARTLSVPLTGPIDTDKLHDIVAPTIISNLVKIEMQVSLRTLWDRVDYGYVRGVVPHCLVTYIDEEGDFACNPQVATDGEKIEVKGYLASYVLGYDFDSSMGPLASIPDARTGLWLALSREIPKEPQALYEGVYVQLPYCDLYSPIHLRN